MCRLEHARPASDAALDMQDAGRKDEDVVRRYGTVRATMLLALGSILNAFTTAPRPGTSGSGT
ncbi:hypothetical protein ACH47Z_39685 [Streptomyces sp. NPDC020192]|uniref:hypothetical protein n=1 Tax=Streptomyces sp. NPDC020192 TaxID=3365066 RepID=UPI00379CBC42